MNKKILSLLLLTIFIFSSVAVSATGETLTLTPGDGDIIYDAPESFSASIEGAESILFYLDGTFFGEADSTGQINAPEISYGKHKLTSVAIMADGSAVKSETNFEYRKKMVFAKLEQDFTGFTADSDPADFDFKFGNSSKGTLTPVAGPSGKNDDVAIKIEVKDNAALTGGGPSFKPNFTYYNKGIAQIEFDIKHNTTTDSVGLTNPFLWSGKLYLVSSGVYTGTDVAPTTEWTHLKFIFDNDQKLVSFYVNGNPVVNSQPFGKNSNYKNTGFTITTNQFAKKANAVHGGASFDNFKAICQKEYLGITKTEIADGKMELFINEGLSSDGLSKESVTLCTRDGQNLPLSDVIYNEDEKTLTLIPINDFPADSEIVATLSENLMFADEVPLGSPYEASVTTPGKANANVDFKINSDALYTHRQINADDVISAEVSVENTSGEPLDALYILALRSNKRLVAMSSKTLKLSIGQTEKFTLELPEIESSGDYEVKLMVIDSFEGNKAIGRYVKLN